MKRGNTALKRVVSVASVAGMALALAVVAAPAASAAAGGPVANIADLQVRVTPPVDAAYAGDTYDPSATYADSAAIPVVGVGSGQQGPDLQVTIPTVAGSSSFGVGETFTITLDGATFSANPAASISGVVDISKLDQFAGHTGTNAHVPPAVTVTGDAPSVSSGVRSADRTQATFTLSKAAQAGVGGYIVSISNVQLTVADDAAPTAVTATVDGSDVDGAGTEAAATIAYTSPYTLSVSDGYPADTKGALALPDVTVKEQGKAIFANTDAFGFAASGDLAKVGVALGLDSTDVTVTSDSAILLDTATVGATAAKKFTGDLTDLALDGVKDDAVESITVSGLTLTGLKAGANVTLSLTDPLAADGVNAGDLAATAPAASGASVTFGATSQPNRIAGDSRYATAQNIAKQFGVVDAVVLANALDAKAGFDALSANFLAGAKDAPILLTDSSDSLPTATQAALTQAFKGQGGTLTIYIAGKTDSVSAAAEAQAKFLATTAADSSATVDVVRFDGANRYETSAKIVTEAGTNAVHSFNLGNGLYKTAFLASGTVNADALAAGSVSAGAGVPVLLAGPSGVDATVVKAIKDLNIKQLIVLGGVDRIADSVADGLKDSAGIQSWTRIAGEGAFGRYDTAALLYTTAFAKVSDKGLGQTLADATAYLANGTIGFADALAVGPLAGRGGNVNPLLTVLVDKLPDSTAKFLTDNKANITDVQALGKNDRIADSVITAAQKAIL